MIKIFLYLRDSMGNKEGLKKQEENLMNFVNEHYKDSEVIVYKDEGSSIKDRSELQKLINDINKDKPEFVITLRLNRLYRVYLDDEEEGNKKLADIINSIVEKGANLVVLEDEMFFHKYDKIALENEEIIEF